MSPTGTEIGPVGSDAGRSVPGSVPSSWDDPGVTAPTRDRGTERVAGGGTATVASSSRGAEGRVATVQRQARHTLVLAAAFAVGAAVAAAVPHDTGVWLPLHLFLAGTLLLAVSGASQLFAVTWSAGPAPPDPLAAAQRWLLAAGAVAVVAGRELETARAVPAVGGGAVLGALVLLAGMLRYEVAGGVQRRFVPALRWYLTALAAGAAGVGIGVARVAGGGDGLADRLRAAHVTLNLLGLVGLVVAGTLPFFTATEARVKMSRRSGAGPQAVLLAGLVTALGLAVAGFLGGRPAVGAAGLGAYALGVAALLALLPPMGRKQFRWAGPRLVQLLAGLGWWVAAVVAAAVRAGGGDPPFSTTVIGVLVVGGYAQVLAAALAYLGPVLRGGGHQRLTAGFRVTRDWPGLAAGNVASVAIALGAPTVAGAAVAVWVAGAVTRGLLLARPGLSTPG